MLGRISNELFEPEFSESVAHVNETLEGSGELFEKVFGETLGAIH